MGANESHDWPGDFGNWGRWPNDQGTLNVLTPEGVIQAAKLVRSGITIACSRPLSSYSPIGRGDIYEHEMLSAWQSGAGGDVQASSDRISMRVHGMTNTHMDALCHVAWIGRGFNGRAFPEMVSMEEGAVIGAITQVPPIFTRGVLADIARERGVDYIEPGDQVRVEELRSAAPDLAPGDALLIRTGNFLAPPEAAADLAADRHGRHAGLDPECMHYIAERDVAILGHDGPCDSFPSPIAECPLPIHILAEAYLGLHLIHNMDLDELSSACLREKRSSFLFCVAPLRIPRGTGSPVAPFAVL